MNIKCVLCDSPSGNYTRKSHTSNDFDIHKCSNCGLEYTMPIPSDEDLMNFYTDYNDIRANSNIVTKNVLRNIDLIKKHTNINNKSLVLDFGCGNGEFLNNYGDNCYGVELLENNNNKIKSSIAELEIKEFDCITLFGVLEHLNDIKNTMIEINSYLKKDGYLIITTVDAEGLIPYFYKPPEHLTYWTNNSFEELANLLNLEITHYMPYEMVQYGSIYLERLLSRTPIELQKTIIDNSINKIPEFIEVPTNEIFVIMKKTK